MKHIKATLTEALVAAGDVIRKNITKKKSVEYKGVIDLVTTTDKRVEKIVTQIIHAQFPTHTILAEESGHIHTIDSQDKKNRAPVYKWIIDPLDGTTNFFHSFPQVSTSIACEKDGIVIAGGVHNPLSNELFLAVKGKGARLNGKKIAVSEIPTLSSALLTTGFPYDRREHVDYYLSFMKAFMLKCHGVRRMGSAALDFCYVACGRIDGFWESKLHPWDVAAGSLILEEAGGTVSTFTKKTYDIYGTETLATNGKIHEAMRKVIRTTMRAK